jgi:chemotaxis methyl-accepting protein methylase
MEPPELTAADVLTLSRLLGDSEGIDLSYYTVSFLARRMAVRMRKYACAAAGDYFARLESDPAEIKALVFALTVNVTEFFRDAEVYEVLRDRVVPILTARGPHRLQVWSAGCATGQEPYTLAMILDEAVAARPGCSYRIYASDISPRQLAVAKTAVYPRESIARVPAPYARRWFVDTADGGVAVAPALRANVTFFQHDLSAGQAIPAAGLDLILCRNVMIYFSPDATDRLIESFHKILAPERFLVLGASETILKDRFFRPFDIKNKIFRAVAPGDA